MLNATMCATTRTICVILENYSYLCMNIVITGGVCTYVKCYNVCYNQNYMCDLENYSCLCMNVVITGGVCTYVKCYNVCYNQNYMCDLGELPDRFAIKTNGKSTSKS